MTLIIIYTILSAIGAALTYILTGLYQNLAFLVWFPLVCFFVYWLIFAIGTWVWIMITSRFMSKKKPQKKPSMFAQLTLTEIADVLIFFFGVHIKMSKKDRKFIKDVKKNKTSSETCTWETLYPICPS